MHDVPAADGTSHAERVQALVQRLLTDHPPEQTDAHRFWGAQYDAGLAWVHFPAGCGGLGLPPRLQTLVDDRLAAAGAPQWNRTANVIGLGMAAATIVAHGSPDQRARYLRPLFTAREIWCQLFSEPGAGSDLAGVSTMAVRHGDHWVVNGQKVWTTLAHAARWGLLLARHDPDAGKHAGLTYFVVDMHSAGVDVRPLYQLTGEAEFNEVQLTDVCIPDGQRLGGVGEGWTVALTTLMNERTAIGGRPRGRGEGVIGIALEAWSRRRHDDPAARDELVQLWIEAEALRLSQQRATDLRRAGTPGPEGSTPKLQQATLQQAITSFAVETLGSEGMTYPAGYARQRPDTVDLDVREPRKAYLRCLANSIEGGTSEVLRNVLGERVLGLPGEPRVDKGMAWRLIPRG